MTDNDSARDAALRWAARGVAVFPVAITPKPDGSGTNKVPLTSHGHKDAVTAGPDVAELFSDLTRPLLGSDGRPLLDSDGKQQRRALRAGEAPGVGAVPGSAGFVVFDLDRHDDGKDGMAYGWNELHLPPRTYRHRTGTGSLHAWYRKRNPAARVGNRSVWNEHGIQIRADDGWVVIEAETPWGSWGIDPESTPWEDGAAMVPEALWRELDTGNVWDQFDTGSSSSRGPWQSFDPDKHLPLLHPATAAALPTLLAEGARPLTFRRRDGGEPYVDMTCDGYKVSGTLGFLGPGVLKVFSAGWPNRPEGSRELVLPPGSPVQSGQVPDVDELLNGRRSTGNGSSSTIDAATPGSGITDPTPSTLADELLADRRLADEVADQLRRSRAREIVAEIKARQSPLPAPDVGTLAELLARPAEPPWRVDGLLPAGGRLLLTAIRKTGKTTMVGNLARSLLTGERFLGAFDVRPLSGSVAVLSYEMPERMLAAWYAEVGVPPERCTVVNLRGRRNLLAEQDGRTQLVGILKAAGAEVLVVDTFSRAYTGKSQNDAAEVAAWLARLDELAEAAGISEVVLTAHAGWEGERTRGSTALEDWPEAIVTLTRDDAGRRFLRATGRDVEVDEDELVYDEATRRLSLAGTGSRRTVRAAEHLDELVDALVRVVMAHPGIGVNAIEAQWREDGVAHSNGDGSKASREAVARGLVVVENGPNRTKMHRCPQVPPSDPVGPPVSDPKCLSIEGHSHRGTGPVSDPEDEPPPDPVGLLVDKLGGRVIEAPEACVVDGCEKPPRHRCWTCGDHASTELDEQARRGGRP